MYGGVRRCTAVYGGVEPILILLLFLKSFQVQQNVSIVGGRRHVESLERFHASHGFVRTIETALAVQILGQHALSSGVVLPASKCPRTMVAVVA